MDGSVTGLKGGVAGNKKFRDREALMTITLSSDPFPAAATINQRE